MQIWSLSRAQLVIYKCIFAGCLSSCQSFEMHIIFSLADIGVYLSYWDFQPYVRSALACTKELNKWFSKKFEKVFLLS
jgi:hypothetical protein